jgi:DNA-binding NtrC family response regulator
MTVSHFLIYDRDPSRRASVAQALRGLGHTVVLTEDAAGAAQALGVPGLNGVFLDLSSPDLDPLLLRRALAPAEPASPDSLEAAERRHIALALRFTNGNKRRTAHLLGIARSTLLAKVRKYGLEDPAALSGGGAKL